MFDHHISIHNVHAVRLEAPNLLCTGTWSRRLVLESRDGEEILILFYAEGEPPRLSCDWDELPPPPDPTAPFKDEVRTCKACGENDVDLLWGFCENCLEDNYHNL